jgi:hypothetical protein
MNRYLGGVSGDHFDHESLAELEYYEDDQLVDKVGLTTQQIQAFRSAAIKKVAEQAKTKAAEASVRKK